jgi:hypothetical protein
MITKRIEGKIGAYSSTARADIPLVLKLYLPVFPFFPEQPPTNISSAPTTSSEPSSMPLAK